MKRFEWNSTPLINLMLNGKMSKRVRDRTFNETMAMHHACNPAVKSLKEKLGRQDFTWMGSECKNWIWEGADWRVFASELGVTFEVREGLTTRQALVAWRDFLARIGIKPGARPRGAYALELGRPKRMRTDVLYVVLGNDLATTLR